MRMGFNQMALCVHSLYCFWNPVPQSLKIFIKLYHVQCSLSLLFITKISWIHHGFWAFSSSSLSTHFSIRFIRKLPMWVLLINWF
jgi:hypothetical protein